LPQASIAEMLEMARRVFLDLHCVAQELIERADLDAALVDCGRRRQGRAFHRQRFVARERNESVLVAHKALAGQPIRRRHVVDFGINDFFPGDFPELAQQFLFLFGQRNSVTRARRQVLDLDNARPAIAILAIEGNGNVVGLGKRKEIAAITGDGINGDVARHDRRRKSHVGHEFCPFNLE